MLLLSLVACSTPDAFLRQYAALTYENDKAYFHNYESNIDWACGDEPAAGVEELHAEITPAILSESITVGIESYTAGACDDEIDEEDLTAVLARGHCFTFRSRLGETCDSLDTGAVQACLASLRFATCEDIDWDGYRAGRWTPGQPACDAVCE